MFINYPNNPTGAVVPEGFFEEVVGFAREHEILVVHDNAYSETTYDGYVAPSFLATPGAKEVGVEVFSLSKGYNMTGWRVAAILGNPDAIQSLLAAQDQRRLRPLRGGADGRRRRPAGPARSRWRSMNATYARRRDLVVAALGAIGVDVTAPKGTIYVWAPVPEGHTSTSFAETVLEEAAVVVSPGSMYGPSGEGFFRISLTDSRRADRRGRRADARTPDLRRPHATSGLALGFLAPIAVEAGPLVGGRHGLEHLLRHLRLELCGDSSLQVDLVGRLVHAAGELGLLADAGLAPSPGGRPGRRSGRSG